MTQGGDRPRKPHCALDSVVTSNHDEESFRRRLWHGYGVLVINTNDERLLPDERNGVMAIGKRIFEGEVNGR